MTADKRTVTTDALETLGTIIGESEGRDAIHLAVEPVTAADRLAPGEHVMLVEGQAHRAGGYEGVGIVDPFLTASVQPGERFWLVVYPRTITSLRHVWSHPAFPDAPASSASHNAESEEYLRRFAARLFSYYDGDRFRLLLNNAERGHFGTDIEYGEDCEPTAEFWTHFERYTGRKVPSNKRPEYFSCAC